MESQRYETEKVVYNTKTERRVLKIAYTNVNGLLPSLIELNDYLRVSKPDVMAITETKLCDEIDSIDIGGNRYNVWTRNRNTRKGGGVLLLRRNLK